MLKKSVVASSFGIAAILPAIAVMAVIGACSSTTNNPGGDSGARDSANNKDTAPATCASPGITTAGPPDTHCMGMPVQVINAAACTAEAGAPLDAGADAGSTCDWGATMYGQEADDDDCKYHVKWTAGALCQGAGGVPFTVSVTLKGGSTPVTSMLTGLITEVFIPTDPAAACDNKSTHPSPTVTTLTETTAGAGVYTGNIVFDRAGQWTVRFHFHDDCTDSPDSPHGHAAFRVTLP